MGIWDDFKKTVSDVWDAGVNFIEGLSEASEEAVEEAGEVILEEILGLDDISSGEGSDGGSGSEGHDHDADFGDNASGLQVADLSSILLKSVKDAQDTPDFLNWFAGEKAFGTVDDVVTEPDATHVFDDVAAPVSEIAITIDKISGVATTDVQSADTTADTLKFVHHQSASAEAPAWTEGSHPDPGPGLLQLPPYLASSNIFTEALEKPDQTSSIPKIGPGDFAFATTLDEASPTLAVSLLF